MVPSGPGIPSRPCQKRENTILNKKWFLIFYINTVEIKEHYEQS